MEAKLNATQEMKGKSPFQGQVRQTLNYPQTTQSCCATPDGAPQETLSPHFFTFSLWILKRTDFLETFGWDFWETFNMLQLKNTKCESGSSHKMQRITAYKTCLSMFDKDCLFIKQANLMLMATDTSPFLWNSLSFWPFQPAPQFTTTSKPEVVHTLLLYPTPRGYHLS